MSACFCSNEDCAKAGRCLGPKRDNWGIKKYFPDYPDYYQPRPLIDEEKLAERIAARVVEILNKQKLCEGEK